MNDPRKQFRSQIWEVLKHPDTRVEQKNAKLKHSLWEILDQGKGSLGKRFNLLILFFIIFSIMILPLELIPEMEKYHGITEVIEIVITAFFTFEYILRIYAAPKKLKYIFSVWGIIDLISVLPYYISLAQFNTQIFRILRLGRIFRILKVTRIRSAEMVEEEIKKKSSKSISLMANERIEHVVMHHPLFFVVNLLLPIALGSASMIISLFFNFHQIALTVSSFFLILALFLFYKAWNDQHYDVLYLTNHRIIFQDSHIFGQTQNQVDYIDISNIRPIQTGILSYVFRFGSIIVETASDQSLIEHKNVKNYQKFSEYISQKCHDKRKERAYFAANHSK